MVWPALRAARLPVRVQAWPSLRPHRQQAGTEFPALQEAV